MSKEGHFEGLGKPGGKVFKILECFMLQTRWDESETLEGMNDIKFPLRKAGSGGTPGLLLTAPPQGQALPLPCSRMLPTKIVSCT